MLMLKMVLVPMLIAYDDADKLIRLMLMMMLIQMIMPIWLMLICLNR